MQRCRLTASITALWSFLSFMPSGLRLAPLFAREEAQKLTKKKPGKRFRPRGERTGVQTYSNGQATSQSTHLWITTFKNSSRKDQRSKWKQNVTSETKQKLKRDWHRSNGETKRDQNGIGNGMHHCTRLFLHWDLLRARMAPPKHQQEEIDTVSRDVQICCQTARWQEMPLCREVLWF